MDRYVQAEKVRIAIMDEIVARANWDCKEDNDCITAEQRVLREEFYEYFLGLIATAKTPA